MKSIKCFAVILLFLSFSFTNCSPDQDYLFTTEEIITRGNWDVDFFIDDVKTAEYDNYVFQFYGNGTLQGTDGTTTIEGGWNVIQDVDRSDLLTMTIEDQHSMAELNNTWIVKARNVVDIKMQVKGNTSEFRLRKL